MKIEKFQDIPNYDFLQNKKDTTKTVEIKYSFTNDEVKKARELFFKLGRKYKNFTSLSFKRGEYDLNKNSIIISFDAQMTKEEIKARCDQYVEILEIRSKRPPENSLDRQGYFGPGMG